MEPIDNLFIVNSNILAYRTNNNFTPSILPDDIASISKLDKFKIDSNGSRLITFLLNTKIDASGELAILIFQKKSGNSFIKVFPEDFGYDRGYYIHGLQIIGVPKMDLKDVPLDKKKLFQELSTKYSKETIDLNFMSQILGSKDTLTDDEFINNIILDKLEIDDLINLGSLSAENKNRINQYITNKINKEYNIRIQDILNGISLFELYENFIQFGLSRKFANWIAEKGLLKILIWLKNLPGRILPTRDGANLAVKNGHLNVLEWLYNLEEKILPEDRSSMSAAASGYLDILKWLVSKGIELDLESGNYAAESGQLHVLQWLFERGILSNIEGANRAAGHGQLHILRWLANLPKPILPDQTGANWAAESGHSDVLLWMISIPERITPTTYGANWAAMNGQLDTLIWLKDFENIIPDETGANLAAVNGQLHILTWLSNLPKPVLPNKKGANYAAGKGHLNVLKWLANLPEPVLPNRKGANNAARNGHFSVLLWLTEPPRNILPTSLGATKAMKNDFPEIVKWLKERNIHPGNI